MKTRELCCILLMALTLISSSDMMAQKRKARSGSKARTTASARKSATAVTGPALDASKLVNIEYCGYICGLGDANINGFWIFQQLTLEPENINWELGTGPLGGPWKVTGNNLSVTSKNLSLKMKSPDGGTYFIGKFAIKGDRKVNDSFLYRKTLFNTPVDTTAITRRILDGKFTAFVYLYREGDPSLGATVKIKLTPGENPNEGTYKITSDNKALATVLGVLRGTYKFDEKGFYISQIDGSESWLTYKNMNSAAIEFRLGKKSIPNYNTRGIYLCFFFK